MVWTRIDRIEVTSKHSRVTALRWSRGIARISVGSRALTSPGGVTSREYGNIPVTSPAPLNDLVRPGTTIDEQSQSPAKNDVKSLHLDSLCPKSALGRCISEV
jgi:hypothetical protein